MTVDPVSTDDWLAVRNPRTGALDARIKPTSPAEVAARARRLRAAQPAWAELGVEGRIEALRAFAKACAKRRDDLVSALEADTGRLTETAMEVDAIAAMVERWARWAPDVLNPGGERTTGHAELVWRQHHAPYPLLGVISPWNSPLGLSLIDAVPALIAGCVVLIKPSEVTPRFLEPLGAALAECAPLNTVLAFVAGAAQTGEAVVAQADAVCFTGSVATGRKVAVACAQRLIPAFLELGGKDPAIVLEGADLDRAAAGIAWGGTMNAGQLCLSIERVYVEQAVADAFTERLVGEMARLRHCDADTPGGALGPVIFEPQAAVIRRHLDDARAKGARVLTGGTIEQRGGGLWCAPTVLTRVDHSMAVMTEETFGPLLPVMTVSDAAQALQLANDTIYGLSASVWGPETRAADLAARINAGAVSVNDAALTSLVQDAEKMAFGQSGLGGSRMGPGSILRFVRKKAVLLSRFQGADPWWFTGARLQAGRS
ncbi:MAG: aldehyde dehydrogenase family protein [Oceanicaulis sp.]